jgi:phosphoribosylamine--glycine ligase
VILPSIDTDFADLCEALASSRGLYRFDHPSQMRHACCVVLTSAAYPEVSNCDDVIIGISEAERVGAYILHAGTAWKNRVFTTNKSGRVLNSVGIGPNLVEARAKAYAGAEKIRFPGMQYRRDIASMYKH